MLRAPSGAALSWLLLALAAAGCGATLGTESAGASTVLVDVPVAAAPPPDRVDPPKPAAPGFGYIWVAGHWDSIEGNYIWKSGRWLQGRADYEYVRARYEFDPKRQQWVYHRPHWKRRHTAATPAISPSPPGDGGTGAG